MSALDQPLLIETSNYHVGQLRSLYVAEEQGFFREEGVTRYVLEGRGLVPGPLESAGLGLAMKEHGTDIAVAVDVRAAVRQCAADPDLFIVGGWRLDGPAGYKWYASKNIAGLAHLRGRKIGIREPGVMGQNLLMDALRRDGIDPETDVEWVYDDAFYIDTPARWEKLRSGRADVVQAGSGLSSLLEQQGYHVVFDPNLPGGRPGKVIVATKQTVERRAAELTAFLRANIRAFWFVRNAAHFQWLAELETRMREQTHNEFERTVRIGTNPEEMERSPMPVDGGVPRPALQRVIEEMVAAGHLERVVPLEDVLRDDLVIDAYQELAGRPDLHHTLQEVRAVVAKCGF